VDSDLDLDGGEAAALEEEEEEEDKEEGRTEMEAVRWRAVAAPLGRGAPEAVTVDGFLSADEEEADAGFAAAPAALEVSLLPAAAAEAGAGLAASTMEGFFACPLAAVALPPTATFGCISFEGDGPAAAAAGLAGDGAAEDTEALGGRSFEGETMRLAPGSLDSRGGEETGMRVV